MDEKQLSVVDEVKAKEQVWDYRDDFDRLMRQTTQALADHTHSFAIAATDDGDVWNAGHGYVFEHPEFYDRVVAQSVFLYFDEIRHIQELMFSRFTGLSLVEVLFGEELGWPHFDQVGVVGTRFSAGGHHGALAVVGPFRLSYPTVIPTMRYFKSLLEELIG
jgi:transcriptional regulator of heat shock response